MAICPIIVHFNTLRARSMDDVAWRGMWICVRSRDAQKQLARTSLIRLCSYLVPQNSAHACANVNTHPLQTGRI